MAFLFCIFAHRRPTKMVTIFDLFQIPFVADDRSINDNNNDMKNKNNNVHTVGELPKSPSTGTGRWHQRSFQPDVSNEQESGFHDAHLSADFSHDSILDGDLAEHPGVHENKRRSPDGSDKKARSKVTYGKRSRKKKRN